MESAGRQIPSPVPVYLAFDKLKNWVKNGENRAKQILKKVVTVPWDYAEKRTKRQRIGNKIFLILTKYFDPVHLLRKIMIPFGQNGPKNCNKMAKWSKNQIDVLNGV